MATLGVTAPGWDSMKKTEVKVNLSVRTVKPTKKFTSVTEMNEPHK